MLLIRAEGGRLATESTRELTGLHTLHHHVRIRDTDHSNGIRLPGCSRLRRVSRQDRPRKSSPPVTACLDARNGLLHLDS